MKKELKEGVRNSQRVYRNYGKDPQKYWVPGLQM